MDIQKILETDSSRMIAEITAKSVKNDPEKYSVLYSIAVTKPSPLCWRAVRALDICCEKYKELFIPYVADTVCFLKDCKNESLKRSFLRILARYVDDCDNEALGILLDKCFEWFLSPVEPIAVKAFSLDVLMKINQVVPEIKDEIIASIEAEIPRMTSAAFKSRCRKVLKKML